MNQLLEFFRQVPLFRDLNAEELNELIRGISTVDLGPGQRLFAAGELGDAAFVIQSGELEIRIPHGPRNLKIARLKPGELLGELSLIDGAPRNASVWSLEMSRLYRIDKREFDFLRRNRRPVAYKLLRSISRTVSLRIRETNEQISSLLAPPEPSVPAQVEPQTLPWWRTLFSKG